MGGNESRRICFDSLNNNMNNEIEIRTYTLPEVELRADTDSGKFVGYAALYNTLSQDLGGFREKIRSGAFERTLKDESIDTIANVDHSTNVSDLLGRSSDGTLELRSDKKGLRVEIDPPQTQTAKDVQTLLGDSRHLEMSFAFRAIEEDIDEKDGVVQRELIDLDLYDVAIVTRGAYSDTSIAMRTIELFQEGRQSKEEETPAEKPALNRAKNKIKILKRK